MFRRSKIIIFGLAVLLIFTGVIYAQNQKELAQQDDKFEIAQNMDDQNTEEQNNDQAEQNEENTAEKTTGMINFEELMAVHPQTQEIYNEYQLEKEEIENGENTEENLMKLKEKYHQLVVEATKVDLEKFAASQNINLLLINDKVVLGEKADEQELTEVQDLTAEFKDFLNN
ncbi:hypothetical protein C8C77_10735 [Halanaerobium saccharolyticum]|uniref:Uncharacterized protein n=1 Tax=Halanaerobium saccharolyticum TaxID=43595 RepID=A0A4R7Z7B4_9FIRM|nr:hypothetical protein [Halanaerobium saccharolyticum]RAK12664.1 hypothetical protein C7958_101226 [Halanaerobium saccharolyticum]TDW05424.1 hypothetical protein C8C77_10735 [Halanaerobium saccharolyticum]TDX62939.1 hypothetical protein C7956_103106 [Halanaerobium saccharolyticum]